MVYSQEIGYWLLFDTKKSHCLVLIHLCRIFLSYGKFRCFVSAKLHWKVNTLKPFLLLLLHRNSVMFNNELMADVHFVVGQTGRTERLPGHRVRLPSASKITAVGRKLTNELSAPVSSVSDEREKTISLFASCNGTKVFVLSAHVLQPCVFWR